MKQRIITGIVLVIVLLPCIIFGGWIFKILIALISVGAAYELLHITHDPDAKPYLYITEALFILAQVFLSKELLGSNAIIIIFMIVLMTCGLFDETMPMLRMGYYFIGGVLIATGLHMIYALRIDYGLNYLIFLAAATLLADTGAYFTGMKFGKHKLNPRLSPKKTIEGSVGGTLVGGLLAILLALVLPMSIKPYQMIICAFVLSTTGQIGDLTFSSFKRTFEIKDYSQLFPGHGGILDRFDSIIFNAMVFGLLLQFML